MNLTPLLGLIDEIPAFRQMIDSLEKHEGEVSATALEAAKPYLIAALYHRLRQPILLVTAQPESGRKFHEQMLGWYPDATRKLFPEPDALPYQRITSDTTTEIERIQTLSILGKKPENTKISAVEIPLIITSAPALIHKVPVYDEFASIILVINKGMEIEPMELMGKLEAMGYQIENIVEIPGIAAHRGGIVDIFPSTSDSPVRLEFYGNTVESIRFFDPATQRSTDSVSPIVISPATELPGLTLSSQAKLEQIIKSLDLSNCTPEMRRQLESELEMLINHQRPPDIQFYSALFNSDSILDYLGQNYLVVIDEPSSLKATIEDLDAEATKLRKDKVVRGELPHNFPVPYFTWTEIETKMKRYQRLTLNRWGETQEDKSRQLNFASAPNYAGQLNSFIKKLKQRLSQRQRIILVSQQASRLSELLAEEDILATPVAEIQTAPVSGSVTLVQGSLAEGWVMNNSTHLYTDNEIFGFTKQRRLARKRPVPYHKFLGEMTPGDYVVHVDHGIGRFAGITTRRTNGIEKEYLVLQYGGDDRLYVPTDQIDRINRYIGAKDQPPVLSRLGTQEWLKAKKRIKESVETVARELLVLYVAREIVPGFAFSPDTIWQQEFEASFPYVETPDQLEVQKQVKEDMEKTKPMDRLVCGDVGYGKTEIAVRAAFKTVMDSRQVAMLVPTTVLAQQHFTTFSQRLSAFPVRVEVLSRFRSAREQQEIIEGLADGTLDICIGTHRLLQKDIMFKDLGLLIIDEEQRFGVAHKEYLKKLRQEVDVLTLSATPIPRTLHMSLVGVRDMSTMETPPEDRLPVKTYVAEYDERLVREAILREMERNGQVFFLHNRVQSIAWVASQLQILVPEARIAVAHGQMPEGELERVMADFASGKSDVLVCSTIIESGLDLPRVNTLIVNKADRFGLTQLYQLRGRVGRGAELAYAYFLYDKGKRLTPTAEKRLQTIYEATELGSGFNIAMRDLEIRGTGTLLGTRQSGHINAVGFTLYCNLLAEAVEQQKAKLAKKEVTPHLPPPTIDLPLTAYIPEDYVSDLNTRLGLYQKLAKTNGVEQIQDITQEFSDRFGPLPPEVKNLLSALKIKVLAARAGVESITHEKGEITLRLIEGMQLTDKQRQSITRYGVTAGQSQIKLDTKRLGDGWEKVLEEVLRSLGKPLNND